MSRVAFEDGSTCDCSPTCADSGTCCDDWPELCAQGIYKEQPLPPCPEPSNPPLVSAARQARVACLDDGSEQECFGQRIRDPVPIVRRPELVEDEEAAMR